MRTEGLQVLVVGCGGIGGNIAARLLEHPSIGRLTVLSTNDAIRDAVNARGFVLQGVDGSQTIPAPQGAPVVVERLGPDDRFDFVLLATQPPQVEDAARGVLANLADDGAMVVLQNGLCEARIAHIAGPDRVIGAIVAWGASMPEPGLFERTSSGGFTIGRLDGAPDSRLQELQLLLEVVGPVTETRNLAGARWSKLAFNNAISTLGTIGGDRVGALMRRRIVRRMALELMTETVEVARAEGVQLEPLSGTVDLEWLALTAEEKVSHGSPTLVAKHSMLLAVGTRYRRMRSSMLAALERGRVPAIDFLNGEVVTRAARHGLDVPVNAACHALVHRMADKQVHRMADKQEVPGIAALEALHRRTRALGSDPAF